MKFINIFILLILVIFSVSKQITDSHRDKARQYFIFAKLPYCEGKELENNSCNACDIIQNEGYTIHFVTKYTTIGINFKMVISTNEEENKVVISFAGPKSRNIEYIQSIYVKGFIPVKELGGNLIEIEFWRVYKNHFRNSLIENLQQLQNENNNLTFIFVGHSWGGSIATLAAYDMTNNQIIKKSKRNGPFIFTYAALKMGQGGLVSRIKHFIGLPIIRVRRRLDFFTLIPRCVYQPNTVLFRCYPSYVNLIKSFPVYLYYFYSYSPVIRQKLLTNIPGILKKNGVNTNLHSPVIINKTTTNIVRPTIQKKKGGVDSRFIASGLGTFGNNNIFQRPVQKKKGGVDSRFIASGLGSFGNNNIQHQPRKVSPNGSFNQNKINHRNLLNNLPNQIFSVFENFHNGLSKQISSLGSSLSNTINRRPSISSRRHSLGRTPSFGSRRGGRRFGNIFLELSKQDANKICTNEGNYLNCEFSPSIHREFFGENVEEC
jgi:hypothetical protein